MARRILVSRKVDLDTIGSAFFLGVSRDDEVEAVNSASEEDLLDPTVTCIECGGAGQISLCNFDHHGISAEIAESATFQVWRALTDDSYGLCDLLGESEERVRGKKALALPAKPEIPEEAKFQQIPEGFLTSEDLECLRLGRKLQEGEEMVCPKMEALGSIFASLKTDLIYGLVLYIDVLDIKGASVFREVLGEPEFPTLSDVVSGMLLTTREPVEQLHRGVEILRMVAEWGINPFGTMPELPYWADYCRAKAENNRQLTQAVAEARWETTSSGLKLGYLETKFFGAPGALYGSGAQVVVALNPDFKGVRKFTIAGNDIRVDAVLPTLEKLEPGWGGPATGTIVGSPREGSKLSLEEVVAIVKRIL